MGGAPIDPFDRRAADLRFEPGGGDATKPGAWIGLPGGIEYIEPGGES